MYLFHYGVMLGLIGVSLGAWRGEAVLLLTFLVSAVYIRTIEPLVQRRRSKVAAGEPIRVDGVKGLQDIEKGGLS